MKQQANTSDYQIHVPLKGNEIAEEALNVINNNQEIRTLWKVMNVNAINRLGMADHGTIHFQIVSNIGIRFVRLLTKSGVEMSVTKSFGLDAKYAELIVLLGSLFHDIGMSIHRDNHEEYSLFMTNTLLRECLQFIPVEERTVVISETLHAIISHRSDGVPFTIEAGILRVADALDMSNGRTRIPYQAGNVNIHSVSAVAIESVDIKEGVDKPISIDICMNNSAGIFQVDELLKKKIIGSGIEKYITVRAFIDRESEESLLKEFVI